ncbi:MAG: DNA (cytosine-5-)-methyltransferase [Spirochaetia bacterium]|nr:DNA (cytosine-5-)-methyltransferase [Spirochaetia bacterium]
MGMKGLSLFSGIGGLDIAAEWAGIETIGFCEIEPYPVSILRKRWKDVPVENDVRSIRGSEWGNADIVFGGFPCQDLSVAGKQKGLWDEDGTPTRSGLWFEMLRVIHEIRPRWVLAENVRGAVNKALDTVQSSLGCEGYKVWSLVIPASAVGAPHQRERLFVVGAREDVADSIAERLQGCEWGCSFSEQGSPTSEPTPPCGEGGKLWPTPISGVCGMTARTTGRPLEKSGHLTTQVYLAEQRERLWPTPRANKVSGYSSEGYGKTLPQVVDEQLWPTPSVCGNYNRKGASATSGDGLATAVGNHLWRTPDANCSRGASSTDRYQWKVDNSMPISINDQVAHEGKDIGQLSPDWVECLMGYPIGWTDVDCEGLEQWQGFPALMGEKQYPYEPPRTGIKIPNRAKRLKALGNAVVPQQAYPLFRAIAEMDKIYMEGIE